MLRSQSLNVVYVAWIVLLLLLQHHTTATAAYAAGSAAETQGQDNGTAAAAAATTEHAAGGVSRFFIDEGYFLEGDTEVLRAYISASDGRMTISGESTAAFLSVKGYYSPDTWEVYWTIRQACHMAYQHMGPHQKVNCIPGISAMSLKRSFVSTWQQAYGELAFDFIPRSYLLPEQYWVWRSHLLATGSPADKKWVLKANIHRGKGVSVVPQRDALSHALTHSHEPISDGSSSSNDVHYLNVLVQSYLENQLVIAGRSSYIRVWLLVTSVNPLRAYLFDGGFAIFGKQKGAGANSTAHSVSSTSSSSSTTDDLIVNLWIQDRNSSPIWSLKHLQEYLGAHPEAVLPLPPPPQQQQQQQKQQQQQQQPAGRRLLQANTTPTSSSSSSSSNVLQPPQRRTFADAWRDMQTSASLVLAAALPAMRAAAAETNAPPQGTFEYFGLDFVLDAHLRPWMLEVNAIPSMARRKKTECSGTAATAECKLMAGSESSSSSSSNASDSGAAAAAMGPDDFDAQKEHFVHDMLVLLGLPVGKPTTAAAAAGGGTKSDTASHDSQSDAARLLHTAAAAAAAADIRFASPAAPAAPAADAVDEGNSSLPSSTSRDSKTDRRLQSLRPVQPTVQGSLSKRVLLEQRVKHKHHSHKPPHMGHHMRPAAAATTANSHEQQQKQQQQQQQQQWYEGVPGLLWDGPCPTFQQLPQELQKLLCRTGGTTVTSSSSSSSSSSSEFACISCLTADDLTALAVAEAELQRAGRFVAVHDLITAHTTNLNALKAAAGNKTSSTAGSAVGSAVGSTAGSTAGSTLGSTVDSTAGSTKGTPAGASNKPSAADAAANPATLDGQHTGSTGVLGRDLYLSQNRTVWQRLYDAWQYMSKGTTSVRDLSVMQYYTTESTIKAQKGLGLQRLDYVMSAWLRVRGQEACGGLTSSDCVVKRLGLLVSNCYL